MTPENSPPIPPDPQGPVTPQEGNGQAIASMVLGILSFVFCGPFFSVPAVILGHMCLGKVRNGVMSQDARGFAMAGTILGWINLGLFILGAGIMLLFAFFASGAGRVSPFTYQL